MMYYSDNYFKYFHKTIVGKLIIINTIIFLFQNLNITIYNLPFEIVFGLLPSQVLNFKVWQVVTYMFLHGSFLHLFFNMFILFMFGLELERIWGGKELLRYYLFVGIGAAIFSFFFVGNSSTVIIGSSGAIFGLFLAYGLIYPERYILLFFVFPLKMKYALVLFTGVSLLLSFDSGTNIAHFTHLGGIIVGFVYLRRHELFKKWNYYLITQAEKKQQQKSKKLEDKINKLHYDVDELLLKISEKGIQSLTDKERNLLMKASDLMNKIDT